MSTNNLFDIKQGLAAELASAKMMQDSTPASIGMFKVKRVNETMEEESRKPDPIPLWKEIWHSGEMHCLFADSGSGKSICAVQIAAEIAKSEPILYLDCELSDKQFQGRYTDKESGELYVFPDNFYRITINREEYPETGFEDVVIKGLCEVVEETGAKVLFLDNILWLCGDSEKGKNAVAFMKRIDKLKNIYGVSVFAIAHTPKRNEYMPITPNDMSGSKCLYNFFDSVSAIGKSTKGKSIRYIKQLKVRVDAAIYSSDNVIVCELCKDGAWTHFKELGLGDEYEHLKRREQTDENELQRNVSALKDAGYSQRKIAEQLGVSASSVCRILNK